MMNYSGYTWLFKSPGSKISSDEVRQTLDDLGAQKQGIWNFMIKDFTNEAEIFGQMDLKTMTRVFTINDSNLSSHIAILMNKSTRVDST
jgi:hypothetical protein